MKVGAHYTGNGTCEFRLWAPLADSVAVRITQPEERTIPMGRAERGYWEVTAESVLPGALYYYLLNGSLERPDPASSYQPQGIDGASQVMDHSRFEWHDNDWRGVPLERMIIYEIHVGTFTPEGTFRAIIPRLEDLRSLGITAIELMPLAQFPGERNWGYDGAYPYAVQNSYGGPEGLRELVDAAHTSGLAVILDAVYNHIGSEGSHLSDFGPYFTSKYNIMWGRAFNFDDAGSDEVKNLFIENALSWFRDWHIDGLRLDASDAIKDTSAKHFLEELAERTEGLSDEHGRKYYLMAETDLNDARLIRPRHLGGYGIDAQWCDDFHHALHTLLTGETRGYYIDFGTIEDMAHALRYGYVYRWKYSLYRKRRHGSPVHDRPSHQFVVFSQNHDQVGNRGGSQRLVEIAGFEAAKVAAAVVLLSPRVPLIFMGEEYAETSPFFFFAEHKNPAMIAGAWKGRKQTLEHFGWDGDPPDPQSADTFRQSKLDWDKRHGGRHKTMLEFYRTLLDLRAAVPAITNLSSDTLEAFGSEEDRLLVFRRWHDSSHVCCVINFSDADVTLHSELPQGGWKKILDSASDKWGGPGSEAPENLGAGSQITLRPTSIVVYELTAGEKPEGS